jgi:hypothetical protein
VKQQLAAVRMLFDWLITGQVAPSNPASAVRGPKRKPGLVVKTRNRASRLRGLPTSFWFGLRHAWLVGHTSSTHLRKYRSFVAAKNAQRALQEEGSGSAICRKSRPP